MITARNTAIPILSVVLALAILIPTLIPTALAGASESTKTDLTTCVAPEVGEGLDVSSPAPSSAGNTRTGALREGWPVNLQAPGSGFPYTPTLFDADGDGADEIFLTGGHTFGLRGDGTFLPGWPTEEQIYMGYGTTANKPGPSVADLESDGDFEILWSERDWYAGSAHMWSFNGKEFDGTDLPYFPQIAPDDYSNALDVPFVLGDVDGDGDLEAWGPHTLGNTFVHYRLSGFDHTGALQFTTDISPDENIVCLYFGDVEGDGVEEMFAISDQSYVYRLYLFDPDGDVRPGYPITLLTLTSGYGSYNPPIPVDLDDDGDLEFIFGSWGSGASWARCTHHDGTDYPGFPIQVATSSQLFYLALGDLTGDGEPELIATDNHLGADYRIHALDLATGTPLPGWPYIVTGWPHGYPAVVDIDNDGFQDVCVSTEGGELHAIAPDGTSHPGYPLGMVAPSISGVAAGDIDGDGLYELVSATWNGWVYAWDTAGAVLPGRADWPMRGVDARNTGIFRKSMDPASVPEWAHGNPGGLRIQPNPAYAGDRIEILLPAGTFGTMGSSAGLTGSAGSIGSTGIAGSSGSQGSAASAGSATTLEILDATGRVIKQWKAVDGSSVTWDVETGYASGVYWARLRSGEQIRTGRVLLLR